MSISSPTCPSLHHLAKAWQDSLEDSKTALQTFQENFDDESRAMLTKALEKTRKAQTAYETVANALIDWKGKRVIAREAVLLEWMKGKMGEVNIEVSVTGEVNTLNVSENKNTADSIINNAMKFCTVFQELQWLDCFDTNISELPKLPDGLQWLFCFDTNISELPKLPDGLKVLSCSNTNLSTIPDLLPDSLTDINIENTPVADDQAVKQKLDAFKNAHSGVTVVY